MIKTFRGLIADDTQDTIVLHTNDGSVGYRIVKFQIMSDEPNQDEVRHVVKIFTISQTAITDTVDFSDQTLLAVATHNEAPSSQDQAGYQFIIFDNMTFNQDIFVTNSDRQSNKAINYYIELEQVKLDLNENTVATLKDIRNKELRTMTA